MLPPEVYMHVIRKRKIKSTGLYFAKINKISYHMAHWWVRHGLKAKVPRRRVHRWSKQSMKVNSTVRGSHHNNKRTYIPNLRFHSMMENSMVAATTAPRSSQADSPKHDGEPHVPPMHQDRDRGLRWHINGIKNVIPGSPTVQRVPQAPFSGMPRPVRTKPITWLGKHCSILHIVKSISIEVIVPWSRFLLLFPGSNFHGFQDLQSLIVLFHFSSCPVSRSCLCITGSYKVHITFK